LEKKKIIFLSTPFSIQAADLLKKISVKAIKIGSGECNNLPLIEHVAKFKKPTIISTGMNSLASITKTFNFAKKINNKIILMHCISMYPAPSSKSMLDTIPVFKKIFKCPVGFSDHSDDIYLAVAAVALGANIIEKHFTLDRNLVGPDHKASLEPKELKLMVKSIRNIEQSLGSKIKKPSSSEAKNKYIVRKSLVAIKPIKSGEKFTIYNVSTKRPAKGISPMQWDKVIGKIANKNFAIDELIKI